MKMSRFHKRGRARLPVGDKPGRADLPVGQNVRRRVSAGVKAGTRDSEIIEALYEPRTLDRACSARFTGGDGAARRPCHYHSGFTLIEVVVSMVLMALILVCAYACLSACLSSRKMIEPRADVLQNARVAMALMSADLRNACPLSSDNPFLGMQRMLGQVEADNLDFATHNYTPRQPRESDYCEVSYYVDKDAQTGQFCLYRRRNPTLAPDPLSGGSREEIAEGVLGVRFEYFDGTDWYDEWGNADHPENTAAGTAASLLQANDQGMPEAVRITLMLDSDPRSNAVTNNEAPPQGAPLVFQTVVRLALADRYQSGGGGNSQASF